MLSPGGPGRLASDTTVSAVRSPEYSSLLGVPASVPSSVRTPFVEDARMMFLTCP